MTPSEQSPGQQFLEATVAFFPNAAFRGDNLSQLQIARRAAAEAQATEAVRILLRSRLRVVFLIVTSLFGVAGCLAFVNIAINPARVPPRMIQGLAFSPDHSWPTSP
jgi:hypothetical protein